MPWKPGQSGNPEGRRLEKDPERQRIRALAQPKTAAAIEALAAIVDDESASPMARVKAAEILLERGHGRASDESVLAAMDNAQNGERRIVFRFAMGEGDDDEIEGELADDERPALPPSTAA